MHTLVKELVNTVLFDSVMVALAIILARMIAMEFEIYREEDDDET